MPTAHSRALMPRHSVINRRNLSPFVRKLVSVTEEAYEQTTRLAATLEVSTGSIVDTALRQLAGMDPEEVLELLRVHGHLTDAEYGYVRGRQAGGGKASAPEPAGRGRSTRKAAAPTSGAKASRAKPGPTKAGRPSKQSKGRRA